GWMSTASFASVVGVPAAGRDEDACEEYERGGLDDEDVFGEHDLGGGCVGAAGVEDVDVHRDHGDEERGLGVDGDGSGSPDGEEGAVDSFFARVGRSGCGGGVVLDAVHDG